MSLFGISFISLPKSVFLKSGGSLNLGTTTFLLMTWENLLLANSSSSSSEYLPPMHKLIIFDEYHVEWKFKSASLTPGTERLNKFPVVNRLKNPSGFDKVWHRLCKCRPSRYMFYLNSESTAFTSFSVELSLKLGQVKKLERRSRASGKASLDTSK